jgi:hypothetical protein
VGNGRLRTHVPTSTTAHAIGQKDLAVAGSGFFQQHGIHKLMSTPHNSAHASYLKRMGFQQETDREGKTGLQSVIACSIYP